MPPEKKEWPGGLPSRQGQTEQLETNTNRLHDNAPGRREGGMTLGGG